MLKNKRKLIHPRKKQKILERDNFKCVNCNCNGDFNSLEVDHIISIKDGGTNDESNLQILCYKCNMNKYYNKDITNKFILTLNPLERLKIIKNRLKEYKDLTYNEFKVVFTQDELFKRLRLNLLYVEDLYRDISDNKREGNRAMNKYIIQRDLLVCILREKTGETFKELSESLNTYDISLSFQQISKICAKFDGKLPFKSVKIRK